MERLNETILFKELRVILFPYIILLSESLNHVNVTQAIHTPSTQVNWWWLIEQD